MIDYFRAHLNDFRLEEFVAAALKEDVGDGDHTAIATIPEHQKGSMRLLVKEKGIIAGVQAAKRIISLIDKTIKIKVFINDGAKVKKGDVAFTLSGNTRNLLTAERLVLNVMQRMSGIATKTARFQSLCKGTEARVIDTRKTTPNFRFFEKWAVLIGGGSNHRFGLYDMILIKDNHIDFCGGISEAIDAARTYLKSNKKRIPIEVETRSLEDVKKVLAHGGVDRIMLDNFSIENTRKAVKLINRQFEVESSGGINEETLRSYAKCGVDFISVGALTHQVKSLDLSLKAEK